MSRETAFRQIPTRVPARRRPVIARISAGAAVLISVLGMASSGSPTTVLAAGVTFAAALLLLWRGNDPPILLLPAIVQWSEVAIKPILTALYGEPIDRVLHLDAGFQADLESAALFGFAGVGCLCLGMSLGARAPRFDADNALRIEAQKWDLGLIATVSALAIFVGQVFDAFAGLAASAYQLVLALAAVKYVGIFGFAYWCFINRTGYRYLTALMAFEVMIGLTGFFADFRGPFLAVALAAVAARPSFRLPNIALMTLMAAVVLCLATFWSAIKGDYRAFANAGSGEQIVVQPFEARLNYIYNAAAGFDGRQFADGFNRLLARQSYIDFLGATLSYVPSVVPHEDGARLSQAVLNILTPRVLFPDKPPVDDDTEVTERYTGLRLNSGQGTSISIGYLGELYVDFGYFGALVTTVFLGMAAGLAYRFLRDYERLPRLITTGICTMLTFALTDFGEALIKFVNGAVLVFVAAVVVQRFFAPRALSFIAGRRARRARPLPRT